MHVYAVLVCWAMLTENTHIVILLRCAAPIVAVLTAQMTIVTQKPDCVENLAKWNGEPC